MTAFIGPRPGWGEHVAGTVRLEVDIELWSNSGRDKHVDVTEQGAWVADFIARELRDKSPRGPNFAIHELRYFGEVKPSTRPTVATHDIGVMPTPNA